MFATFERKKITLVKLDFVLQLSVDQLQNIAIKTKENLSGSRYSVLIE